VPLTSPRDDAPRPQIRQIRVTPEVAEEAEAFGGGVDVETADLGGGGGRAPDDPLAAFARPGMPALGPLAALTPLPDRPGPSATELARPERDLAPIAPPAAAPEINPPLPTDAGERDAPAAPPAPEDGPEPATVAEADAVDLP